ncbi:hypothetical protein HPB52_004487 [Rhipicephalus sanguineus]|uniref:SAP domain-containing protein n=1 Tax=Rhipicephalus sanguineus TaxID=34632 RepID=A0A9D4PBD1_RHISA|nr:hypothetical protein HPB52_004487 [Rhipicephalus sanguineus]
MAQPTGFESTEQHGEGETTARDGATPRRTLSSDSEATIVESLLTTLDSSTMAAATKKQLVDELRVRGLRCSGRKDELIARLIRDNTTRQALEPTDSSTNDQAADDDDRQAHLETLSADNARLRAELNSLRAKLNCATTSEQRETSYNASHNASLPTKRSSPLNDGTNQDAESPAAPTVSTHGGEPSMAQILAALVNTQALLANSLSRGPPTTSPIQIHSTSDTSSSIPTFDGTPQQSAHEWIAQVERIAALAHWTPSLTLVTAANRLTGSAKDWHSAYGSQHDTWEQWKEALTLRFKRKLTMQEFLELQTKRRFRATRPYGIEDDTWANPLAAQLCGTVTELIDRAALLDARRRMTVPWSGFKPAGTSQQLCQLADGQLAQRFFGSSAPAAHLCSGANISIMSVNALTDDIPTHAWVSREDIEVLNRSIRPTLAATINVTLGTTNVRLEDVVVTELPSGIDLILGSDWRRVASVDERFTRQTM